VGDGVTDVSLTTVDAGGRPVVRALLGGAEGRFAVEWFQDGGQGDWGDVTAPDGCDAAGNPYSTRYLRLMDCR
jgi:hypothetical protein